MNANSHKASQRPARAPRNTFLFLSLCLLGLTLAYATEPPEVEKLKGLYIRPAGIGKAGKIPEWKVVRTGTIFTTASGTSFGIKILTRQDTAVFAVVKHYPDLSYSIRDVRIIPIEHIHRFREACEHKNAREQVLIVALAYFEEDCPPETRRIIQAWQIDHLTGEIRDIPREDVLCHVSRSGDLPCKP